jgi:hypothetical protein
MISMMLISAQLLAASILPNRSAIARTFPKSEVHVLDAGHFALDTAADEVASLLRSLVPAIR